MFSNVIYSCYGEAEFSASLLQSSVSHYSSKIILICWFGAQKNILIFKKKKVFLHFNIFLFLYFLHFNSLIFYLNTDLSMDSFDQQSPITS